MFLCNNCWNESLKWQWQCNFCKEWNSLKEFREEKILEKKTWTEKELKEINKIEKNENKIKTKSEELNNVLWWWVTQWSVILLSWEPGIWKSTLTLQLSEWINEDIIYISWEETEGQLWSRSKRLWIKWDNLKILSESCIENILKTLEKNNTKILIIDSISVMYSENIWWIPWSISQVRFISEILVTYAKKTNTTVFIIWHINKDWNLAWPKTLEHMVDCVLYFEWDKFDKLRILRWLKNRFWSSSEIAIFLMDENWLKDIKNPWLEFVNSKDESIGSSLSITIEGNRPIVVETESLTTYTKFGYPKRITRGINSSKLDLIIAVLWKYTTIKLDSYDVYTNIARWIKIEEPWIDLSLAVSIASSKLWKTISKDIIFVWEISLTGKIKNIIHLEKRLKEAEKMWFKKIFVPKLPPSIKKDFNIEIIELTSILELVNKI